MYCHKCGKEIPDGEIICKECSQTNMPTAPQEPAVSLTNPPNPQPVYIDPDSLQTTNGMAIASLLTGLIGFGIVALILGIIANNQIKASLGRQKGSGLAIAGIIIGCIGIVASILLLVGLLGASLFPVFFHNTGRVKAQNASCQNNIKQLSLGVIMYMQDYDEKMPPVDKWSDVIEPYVKSRSIFICPGESALPCGYSFYNRLDRASLKKIVRPADTPMLFDSAGGWNSTLSIDRVLARHNGGYNCSFVDGHVKWIGPDGGTP